MELQAIVVVVGLVLGGVLVIGAVVVGVKKSGFSMGELGMTAFGVVLVGLSLWSRVSLELGEFKAQFDALKENTQEVAEAAAAVSDEVGNLSQVTRQTRSQVALLTRNLNASSIRPEVLESLREMQVATPEFDSERLSGATRDLRISADAIAQLRLDPSAVKKTQAGGEPPRP